MQSLGKKIHNQLLFLNVTKSKAASCKKRLSSVVGICKLNLDSPKKVFTIIKGTIHHEWMAQRRPNR